MDKRSMTALMCLFSRAYHSKENKVKIFDDTIAEQLLSKEEVNGIKNNMSNGIRFFNPDFIGNRDEALRWIVDNYLSPSPLGRAAYTEEHLKDSVKKNRVEQYIIFAAGYDTFAYRQPEWAEKLEIFEVDHPETAHDKKERLRKAQIKVQDNVNYVNADFTEENWIGELLNNEKFSTNKISFSSILGLSYYLSKHDFENLIKAVGEVMPIGSLLVFDYPDDDTYKDNAGERAKKQMILAEGAKEKMLAGYSSTEISEILERCGFEICENLVPQKITEQYFEEYNKANENHKIHAFDNVNYCLAVKK